MKLSEIREKVYLSLAKRQLLGSEQKFDIDVKIKLSKVEPDEVILPHAKQKLYEKGFTDGAKWYREKLKK